MIKILTDRTYLSEHFLPFEFNDCHLASFPLDTALIHYLECIFVRCHATKIIISSGYRTLEEDVRVGGNGKGYHTKGMAVDFVVYDKNNHIIPSKYICCIAQDMGLCGIAKINNTATHIDTRPFDKMYKGDESVSNNTVTDNFYEYFKLSFEEVLKRVS